MENYSVLMSVYHKEKPEYLRDSIQSMLDQTTRTNDFVLVCDGPLTPELDAVISDFNNRNAELFQIVRLEKNMGIGCAANEGLEHCKNDLVAKMDSDDISRNDRCEKQLIAFAADPTLHIVGSHIIEFMDDLNNEISRRIVPLEHADIVKYARRRMPFNNQTVMYRKHKVMEAGGYSLLRRCEDYDLYVRMLSNNCLARNIDDYLVWYRLTDNAFERRGTWEQLKGFTQVRWKMYRQGFSGPFDFFLPCCAQLMITLAPYKLKRYFYTRILRQNQRKAQ